MQNLFEYIKEKREIKEEYLKRKRLKTILEKYGNTSSQHMHTEDMEVLAIILEDEASFLKNNKDKKYCFFGYTGHRDDELPCFFERNNCLYFNEVVFPYTPSMVKHCMDRLDLDERLKHYAEFEDYFKEMYLKIASSSKYTQGNWEGMLLKIKHDLHADWMKYSSLLGQKVTKEQLAQIDWDNFGKEIKPFLAPSYNPKAKTISFRAGTEKTPPTVSLTFDSKTSPSTRSVYIMGDAAYQSINDSRYNYDENISKVWKTYYCYLLGKIIHTLNEEEIER